MTTTTYYNLNIVEGTDIVNPLTVDNPNYETIDEVMHENAVAGVTLATEIANATVHAISRENSECAVIRFIATSEWKAGDTVTVDGVPVTALLPSGETLPDGAYVINANVLCILTGTNLTVYAERKKTDNANEIAYNETTVAAELTELNGSLANLVYLGELDASAIGNTININITPYKSLYIQFGIGNDKVTQKLPIELMSLIQSMTLTEAGDGSPLNAYVTIADVKLGTPKVLYAQATSEQWLSLMRVRFYGCHTV